VADPLPWPVCALFILVLSVAVWACLSLLWDALRATAA